MQSAAPKVGIYDLKGSAVELLLTLKDDNHADPADEERALRNFASFSESFFNSHRNFIEANRR